MSELAKPLSDPHPRALRTGLRFVFALLVGWLMCECLARVLVPPPIFYSTWFTPGVHEPDDQLGFVFRGGFDGAMRNADLVWHQPLTLDDRGFRVPAVQTARGETPSKNIVMLGGASMAFCYGLADTETLHHQVASRLDANCRIDLVSWPGFTLEQDLEKIERFTDADSYDLAVVFAYSPADCSPTRSAGAPSPPADIRMGNSVVLPDDPAADLGGSAYYHSYAVAGVCRIARVIVDAATRMSAQYTDTSVPPASDQVGELPYLPATRQLHQLGVPQVLVVALPRQLGTIGPERLPGEEADGLTLLDLRREFDAESTDWIAYGHYGPRSAAHLAQPIAEAINQALTP